MNTTEPRSSARITGVALASRFHLNGSVKEMQDRFPEIDPKIIRKAYLTFLKNSKANKYGDLSSYHPYALKQLFLDIVRDMDPLRTH